MPNDPTKPTSANPKWPRPARQRVAEVVKTFDDNLRAVSTQLARHEAADHVDRRHVNAALEALSRVGLQRRVWWRRPELEVGFGSFLVGLAFACPDILPVLSISSAFIVPILVALLACGAFCAIHGWFRGKL